MLRTAEEGKLRLPLRYPLVDQASRSRNSVASCKLVGGGEFRAVSDSHLVAKNSYRRERRILRLY